MSIFSLTFSSDGWSVSSFLTLSCPLLPVSLPGQGQKPHSWVHLCLWGVGGFDGDRAIDPASCRSVSVGREKVLAASLFCISIRRGQSGHLACANRGEFFHWQLFPLSLFFSLHLCWSSYISTFTCCHQSYFPLSICLQISPFPFLFLWCFPSFSAPCDLGVISRELNGEARGCISVHSLNSSSTMQTVLACYLHTQRNGWLKNGRLWAGGGNRAGMLTMASHKNKTWHVSLIAQGTFTGNKYTHEDSAQNLTCFPNWLDYYQILSAHS